MLINIGKISNNETVTEKFRNKYRIPSNRRRGWNYAGNGHYFLTIVTYGRESHFGCIENGEMILNGVGQIVYDEFFKSFELRKELFLGEFVLMPNHLHAIVILDKTKCVDDVGTTQGDILTQGTSHHPRFQRKPKSISSFVAGFKSSTINQIDDWIDANNRTMAKFNKNNPLWQSNYYDHIIRTATEYKNITNYIIRNPLKWEKDALKQPW